MYCTRHDWGVFGKLSVTFAPLVAVQTWGQLGLLGLLGLSSLEAWKPSPPRPKAERPDDRTSSHLQWAMYLKTLNLCQIRCLTIDIILNKTAAISVINSNFVSGRVSLFGSFRSQQLSR